MSYSGLATNLVEKSPIAPKKLDSCTSKDYYAGICNNKRTEFQLFNVSEDVSKKLYLA